MKSIFERLTNQILDLNKFYENKALTKDDELEELKNYQDTLKNLTDLGKCLSNLELSKDNLEENTKNLIYIHVQLGNLILYFQNIDEIIIRFIKLNAELKKKKLNIQ